jgi:hypothetical protein
MVIHHETGLPVNEISAPELFEDGVLSLKIEEDE